MPHLQSVHLVAVLVRVIHEIHGCRTGTPSLEAKRRTARRIEDGDRWVACCFTGATESYRSGAAAPESAASNKAPHQGFPPCPLRDSFGGALGLGPGFGRWPGVQPERSSELPTFPLQGSLTLSCQEPPGDEHETSHFDIDNSYKLQKS